MSAVWRLASTYLVRRRMALAAAAIVTVGVAALIVVSALMEGALTLQRSFYRRTLADLTVAPYEPFTRQRLWSEGRAVLEGDPDVAAVAPRYQTFGFAGPGASRAPGAPDRDQAVQVVGIDYAAERALGGLLSMMDEVREDELAVPISSRVDPLRPDEAGHPGLLLGDTLARRLGVSRTGHEGAPALVTLVTSNVESQGDRVALRDQSRRVFRVAGAVSAGHQQHDENVVYVDLRVLRAMIPGAPEATRLAVRLHDPAQAVAVQQRLQFAHPAFSFRSWENAPFFRHVREQKRLLVIILSLVVLVACAAVCGLVWMMVREKTRDIGVLQSLGMPRSRIVGAFTLYGLLLALVGTGLGTLIGVLLARNLDQVADFLSWALGRRVLDAEIYQFREVPSDVRPDTVATVALRTVLACAVASFLPALKASFLRPVDGLCARD